MFKVFFVFLGIALSVFLLRNEFGVAFGTEDFWNHHGLFFLVAIATFPRLTLLFSSVAFGGLFWWAGFFFAPRVLVAGLATLAYWNQNPVLVVISWLVALGGESSEKMVVINRSRKSWNERQARGFEHAKTVEVEVEK